MADQSQSCGVTITKWTALQTPRSCSLVHSSRQKSLSMSDWPYPYTAYLRHLFDHHANIPQPQRALLVSLNLAASIKINPQIKPHWSKLIWFQKWPFHWTGSAVCDWSSGNGSYASLSISSLRYNWPQYLPIHTLESEHIRQSSFWWYSYTYPSYIQPCRLCKHLGFSIRHIHLDKPR